MNTNLAETLVGDGLQLLARPCSVLERVGLVEIKVAICTVAG